MSFTCAQTGLKRDANKERTTYENRTKTICLSSERGKQAAIDRVCARHELESDEFQTAEQKAIGLGVDL